MKEKIWESLIGGRRIWRGRRNDPEEKNLSCVSDAESWGVIERRPGKTPPPPPPRPSVRGGWVEGERHAGEQIRKGRQKKTKQQPLKRDPK